MDIIYTGYDSIWIFTTFDRSKALQWMMSKKKKKTLQCNMLLFYQISTLRYKCFGALIKQSKQIIFFIDIDIIIT